MIDALLREEALSEYQVIALGTLLQNAYSGVERVLRFLMQEKGIELAKSEDWHKRLLAASHEAGLVTDGEQPILAELLAFRHLHVHGYAFKLKVPRLRQLAAPVPDLCRGFLNDLQNRQG
jgi:CBS domain containing-hemolysin-like protein